MKRLAISSGNGKDFGATGTRISEDEKSTAIAMIVGPTPSLLLNPVDDERADDRADRAGGEHEADLPRREVQHAQRVEDEDREAKAAEEVRRAGARGDAPEVRIPNDPVEPFLDLGPHTWLRVSIRPLRQCSTVRIRSRKAVEIAKLMASATIAYGAVSAAISPPAELGPATWATETVSWSFELPSIK